MDIEWLTGEQKVLVLCSRCEIPPEDRVVLRNIVSGGGLDWERIYSDSLRHKTTPLLRKNIESHLGGDVPGGIKARIDRFFHKNAAKNLLLAHELVAIVELFEHHGIPVVPIKGPVLASQLYGDVSMRCYGDIDILVEKSRIESAIHLLWENGYKAAYDLPAERYFWLLGNSHHANLQNVATGTVVELHWELTGRYCRRPICYGDVEGRLIQHGVLGRELLSLGVEDSIVYLAVHGNRHLWQQLDAVCCIGELCASSGVEIDWGMVLQIARSYGVLRVVLVAISLAVLVLGMNMPVLVQEEVEKDRRVETIVTGLVKRLFRGWGTMSEASYQMKALAHHVRTVGPTGVKHSIRKFCVPDYYDMEWIDLPAKLRFLYSFIRPVRLAKKFVFRL